LCCFAKVEGDVLIPPFSRAGLSPENVLLVKTVASRLSPNLPPGCFWISVQDGRATPAAIAIPQLRRRMLDLCEFQRAVGGGLVNSGRASFPAAR
jgi:hypothetical protein